MKKSVKKLSLRKTSILKLNEMPAIIGGLVPLDASGAQGCGGEKTQPGCPTTITG
ncbi:MAG: hypothetical protein AAF611_12080 [Bacteroidota bacterium]